MWVIYIGKKQKCKKGDVIRIIDVVITPQKEIREAYPLTAIKLEKLEDTEGIAKIYTVEKDNEGRLHAEGFSLPGKTKSQEGDRIMILNAKDNKDKDSSEKYPLEAQTVIIINPDEPDAEERVTIEVNKFKKFAIPGLGWLMEAVIKILKRILNNLNLIK